MKLHLIRWKSVYMLAVLLAFTLGAYPAWAQEKAPAAEKQSDAAPAKEAAATAKPAAKEGTTPATPAVAPEHNKPATTTDVANQPTTSAEKPQTDATPDSPATPNPYAVTVAVDEIDSDIMAAKNRALRQATMKGLWQVLEKQLGKQTKEIFDSVSTDEAQKLLASIQPSHENMMGGRYQANVTIVFDPILLRSLMKKNTPETSLANTGATGIGTLLIVPIMQNFKGELLIWEDGNAWRSALNHEALQKGKGKLIMPFGDPNDQLALDQESVLAGEVKPLQETARRYGARNVVIALAKIRASNPKATMFAAEIFLRRAGDSSEGVKLEFTTPAGESVEDMLKRAAREVVQKLTNTANQFTIFEEAEANRTKGLVMRVEYETPQKWLAARKTIEELPSVSFVEVGAVSPEFAQITVYYKGSPEAIQQSLDTLGARIRDTGSFWIVSFPTAARSTY